MKMVRTNNTMKETEARPLTSEEIDALMSKIEDGYHVTTGEDCVTELANQLSSYINELIEFEDAEALSELLEVLYSAVRNTEYAIEDINNSNDDDFDEDDNEQANMPKLYPTMRDAFRAEGFDF